MGKLEDNILNAIDIVVKAKIENAKYDRTIMAQIVSCEDEEIGKYKCKYQGIIITAYSSHPLLKYNINDNVYILTIPEDSSGQGKIIIGKRY